MKKIVVIEDEAETPANLVLMLGADDYLTKPASAEEVGVILGCAENTVKVRASRIFEKLGFENRNAATVRALEVLTRPNVQARTG